MWLLCSITQNEVGSQLLTVATAPATPSLILVHSCPATMARFLQQQACPCHRISRLPFQLPRGSALTSPRLCSVSPFIAADKFSQQKSMMLPSPTIPTSGLIFLRSMKSYLTCYVLTHLIVQSPFSPMRLEKLYGNKVFDNLLMLTLQESEPHLAFGIHSKNICRMNEWIKIRTTRPNLRVRRHTVHLQCGTIPNFQRFGLKIPINVYTCLVLFNKTENNTGYS